MSPYRHSEFAGQTMVGSQVFQKSIVHYVIANHYASHFVGVANPFACRGATSTRANAHDEILWYTSSAAYHQLSVRRPNTVASILN